MTSNDRHASHDSPYRTGQHVPLSQSRHDPLTSVVTSAAESRPDLSSPFEEEENPKASLSSNSNGWPGSPGGTGSPTHPYSPGMRSLTSQQRRSGEHATDGVAPGEIQMQSFHDGAPPPPPVSHSWKKIDRWAERNYEELFDQLGEGCTQNDVNELEHELDCSLPLEVRESLQIHDGQERGGLPTGILFGCMLLDCEEIVQEWKNWRTVSEEFFQNATLPQPQHSSKAFAASSSAGPSHQASNPLWRQELLDRQDSQPPRAIQKAYAHPGWIPLARDWGGNCIAVDLAPGPAGKWGQVIIFGRDYDCKYVVARSWAAFLAIVADDILSEKVFVDEETGELKLKEFKTQNVEPPYLEILRWRVDQKYGRRPPRRMPANGLGLNTNLGKARDSPYGSPTPSEERGRSPHRFSNRGPTQSPKTQFGISSPLARVTEEASSPITSASDKVQESATKEAAKTSQSEDLLEMATPVVSGKGDSDNSASETAQGHDQEPKQEEIVSEKVGEKEPKIEPSTGLDTEALGEMKTVAI
jgi:cell wall assembly regulator SMI1